MAVQNNTMTEQERTRLAAQTPGLARAAAGLRDAAVGVVARPVTALQDAVRVGATQLLGGDPATLPGGVNRYTGTAQQLTDRGVSDIRMGLGEVVNPIRQAGLDALGAQPVQMTPPTPAPQPRTPSPAVPAPTPAATQAATQASMPPRTAEQLESINQGLAYNAAATQAPAPIAPERGNYNLANTSTVDARGGITSTIGQNTTNPISIVGGDGRGYGGFAPGEARAYLDKMAVQDAQERAIRVNERKDGMATMLRIGLQRDAQSNNAYTRRAALAELNRLDADQQARATELAATQRTGLQAAAELQRTNAQGQFGLQQEALRGEAGLAEAELTGQYGLMGSQMDAQAATNEAQLSAQSGSNLKAQAEAMRLARQQAIAAEYEAAGDFAGRDRALGISQPGSPRLTQDALGNVVAVDGRPVTAQEAQAYLQALGYYKTPTQ